MRCLFATLICLLVGSLMPAANAAELMEYREDTPTPPLELLDIHGQPHTLTDYRGKVVLVNFWAGWCHPCLQEIPELIRLAEILAARPFVILAVNVGEKDRTLTGYVKRMDEHMVILMDRESMAFERWNGVGLPSTFVLDGTGRIRYEAYGPVNWDRPDVVTTFTDLMTKPVVEAAAMPEQQP